MTLTRHVSFAPYGESAHRLDALLSQLRQGVARRRPPGVSGVAIVAPRNMRFSPHGATSIDLHIAETVRHSAYSDRITVFAEEVASPFADIPARFWPAGSRSGTIARMVAEHDPAVVIVHQHAPTAAAIARCLPDSAVALVRHNFEKPTRGALHALWKGRRYRRLARIGFVSEALRDEFLAIWPQYRDRAAVIANGVDCAAWRPDSAKERVVLFVGRLAPEKGALEAAKALHAALSDHPDWRGHFIVTTDQRHQEYARQVENLVQRSGGRITLDKNAPHDAVRAGMKRAMIVLAPTQSREAFGRVALEAMASGCALVATARDGFREVAGECALLLPKPDADALRRAVATLIVNDALREKLGRLGLSRAAERYSLARVVAPFDTMISELLHS